MDNTIERLTSVEDLVSTDSLTQVDASQLGELAAINLIGDRISRQPEAATLKRRTLSSEPISLERASLSPEPVRLAPSTDQSRLAFRTLDITPGQQKLSAQAFRSTVQRSNSQQLPFALTVGFDPFAPELELYLGDYDSSPFPDNDPFPTSILATADWPLPDVPSLGTNSFVNGRGSKAGFTVNLNSRRVSAAGKQFRLDSGYNNVAGTEARDRITGNQSDNVLFGFGGNDTIDGSGGNDKISGGSGYDTLNYSRLNADVTIGQFGLITKAGVGVDSLQGDANNRLSASIERIIGDRGQTNSIDVTGAPNDVEVNLQAGFLNIESVSGGGRKGDFDIRNFVNAKGGFGDDTLVGNSQDNVLATGAVSSDPVSDYDSVSGGLGNDRIIGGSGRDSLLGGGDKDTFELGKNGQYFYKDSGFLGTNEYATLGDFQSGLDKIVLEGAASDYTFLGRGAQKTLILRDVDKSGGVSFSDDLVAFVSTGFNAGDVTYV